MTKPEILAGFYSLIWLMAKHYYYRTLPKLRRTIDVEDLFIEGVIGAIQAINTFNKQKGPLAKWVKSKAKWEILDFIIDQSGVPKREFKTAKEMIQVEERLTHILGREPTEEELAKRMNVRLEKIQKVKSWFMDPFDADDLFIQDKGIDADRHMRYLELIKSLHECIRLELTPIERFVFLMRIVYEPSVTLKELAKIIKKSVPTVSRIEAKAKKKLQKCLTDNEWPKEDWIEIIE